MKNFNLILFCFIFFAACQTDNKPDLKPKDLLEYGVPMTILVPNPDSIEVKTSDWGAVMKDITIKDGKDFFIQIYTSQATTIDVPKLKAQELSEVQGKKYFSKIVEDFNDGFIYETKIDSTYTDYGFRYIRVQGSKEYIFQTGLIGPFSLDAVKTMYDAVQQGKK